jgi:hypothetical protein
MKWKVQDTITIERTWYVHAETEDAAIRIAASGLKEPVCEEQIDNTVYEAEPA